MQNTPPAADSPPENVIALLQKAALNHPERRALIMEQQDKERAITFGKLWRQVDSFSETLRMKGLQPGQRVIVMVPMSIDLYIVLLGIIKMGGVAVFVDPWIRPKQLAAFCVFAEPHGYIGIAKSHLLRLFEPKLLKIPLTITTGASFLGIPARYSLATLLRQEQGSGKIDDAAAGDSALITFTSGSSGLPKGANRTHGFLDAQHQALCQEFPYKDSDIDMPMFPVFALNNLAGQRTSIIPTMDFRNVAGVDGGIIYNQIQRHKVTTCTASPPFFDSLASFLEQHPENRLALRRILTGGAVVSDNQLQRWYKAFPATRIDIVYGSTEAEPVAHITLQERLARSGGNLPEQGTCAGKPCSLVKLKIITIHRGPINFQEWQDLEVAKGQAGEVIVSGNHICRDYFNNEAAGRENKIIDHEGTVWHRMGDTGYLDENGLLWLVGRIHSTIIRDNTIVHAQLIEHQLAALFPTLGKVAVLGLQDDTLGEKTTLVLEPWQGAPGSKALRDQVAQHQIIIDAIYLSPTALPLDPRHNSKINYQLLRQQILAQELQEI
ncbi:MAG: AMP-binding protein [Proteobacteria bacterium]|nr:AMP-binding protein [Pseudomonadota bacterium]